MSRSATALAYDYDVAVQPAPVRYQPPAHTYRLLGSFAPKQYATMTAAHGQSSHHKSKQVSPYVELVEEPAYRPYHRNTPQRRLHVAHPQWLVGTLVGVLFLMFVGPVLARGHGSNTIKHNPFQAVAQQAATPKAEGVAPEVDVTTGPTEGQSAPDFRAPASPPYEVLGPPTISVNQIEAVLTQYASPAVGRGQSLYDLGMRYGINPAVALAFFVHESGCGTKGVARFSHSLGNIRWTEGYDNYEGYRSYSSWEAGMGDWYKLITELYINGWNLRTVDAIVPVYAPYGDNNDPPTYIAAVKSLIDGWQGK